MPTISVIIPAYNVERYIGACLDSVLSQEGVDMEVIVVNDGSTDGTTSIIDDYASRHDCIKAISRENGGLSSARNTALANCTGAWITMVDSDDILAPGALKRMFDITTNNENISIVSGRWERFNNLFTPKESKQKDFTIISGQDAAEIMLYQKKSGDIINSSACGKLYRKELWNNVFFKEGLLYEDLQIIPRIFAKVSSVAYFDDVVYGYRQNESSILHTFSKKRFDALDVTTELCEHFTYSPKLYKAALSRHYSAAFNLWLLVNANNADMPEEMARCRNIVRELAASQLFGRKVRLKNRIGAVLQYFPFIFKSSFICKKLLAK